MKILWIKSDFLHPTTRGGRIRTLEMLKRLHQRHEIDYVAYADTAHQDAVDLSAEYCTRAWPIYRETPGRTSPRFLLQLAAGLASDLPVTVRRYRSAAMRRQIESLRAERRFDAMVCDFVFPAPNVPDIQNWILFQHNVETMIWRRQAEHATNPFLRIFAGIEAKRMFNLERNLCNRAAHVVAVSPQDAAKMRSMFGTARVSETATGVDIAYFDPTQPRTSPGISSDLVFVGAMDWLPNIDGVTWFVQEVLPLIRRERPGCTVAIAGRTPQPSIADLARQDPLIRVTGTVPDIRPYLWGSAVSIVPLRIGGGTRLKIYESMAAGIPVVSTAVGAEGLKINPGEDIRIADTPESFARQCLDLLGDPAARARLSEAASRMVSSNFSWDQVTRDFERILSDVSAASKTH
jgi:glycosyltransferase involved in cell wall biosynthesis